MHKTKKQLGSFYTPPHSLYAYLNHQELQQQTRPTPSRIAIGLDDPSYTFKSIEALHRELLEVILAQYGWSDLPVSWVFDKPWIDGTTHYVPDVKTREQLFIRLSEFNKARYQQEISLYLERIPLDQRYSLSQYLKSKDYAYTKSLVPDLVTEKIQYSL